MQQRNLDAQNSLEKIKIRLTSTHTGYLQRIAEQNWSDADGQVK